MRNRATGGESGGESGFVRLHSIQPTGSTRPVDDGSNPFAVGMMNCRVFVAANGLLQRPFRAFR
jgi:hypothetical protein